TVVKDSTRHWPTTRTHRHNIQDKKIQISQLESAQAYPYPADVRYGSIGSIGTSAEGSIRCWLVDPEAEGDGGNARRFRLLARMRFIRDWIAMLGKQSMLAAALNTRLAALEALSDPFQLNRVPLLKGTGEP